MPSAFRLTHSRELPCGCEDFKDLGTYSTRALAEAAKSRAMKLPGFRDYPEGLHIDEFTLDTDRWSDGFVTVVTGRP